MGNSEPIKFLLAGGIATLVQYAALVLLVELADMNPVLASVLGYAIGAVVNYLLNYYFTFLSEGKHFQTALKFSVVVVSALSLNALIMYICTELLQIYYLIGQVIATLMVLVWNFFAHKLWTYKMAGAQ
jgi:putative flippase GtrA